MKIEISEGEEGNERSNPENKDRAIGDHVSFIERAAIVI